MFIEAAHEVGLTARNISRFPILLAPVLRDKYGFRKEGFEAMDVYLRHFLQEVRSGKIKI